MSRLSFTTGADGTAILELHDEHGQPIESYRADLRNPLEAGRLRAFLAALLPEPLVQHALGESLLGQGRSAVESPLPAEGCA